MDIFRSRLPSRRESVLLFAVCAFPVCTWTSLWFLHKLPSWLLFLPPWDIIGVLAYAQVFALVESVLIFMFLTFLWVVFPVRVLGGDFVVDGSALMLTHVFWLLVLHAVGSDIPTWSWEKTLLLLLLYLISVVTSLALVRHSERTVGLLQALAERLVVMIYVYVPLGVLGLFTVVVGNFLGMG